LEKKQRKPTSQNGVPSNLKPEAMGEKSLNRVNSFKNMLCHGIKNELPSLTSSDDLKDDTKSHKKSRNSDDEAKTEAQRGTKDVDMVESKNNENSNLKTNANSSNEDELKFKKDRSILTRKAKATNNSTSNLNKTDDSKNTQRIIKDMENLI
jgi:hypothetical protein